MISRFNFNREGGVIQGFPNRRYTSEKQKSNIALVLAFNFT